MITIVDIKRAIIERIKSQIDTVPESRICFDLLEQGIEYPAIWLRFQQTVPVADISGRARGLSYAILLADVLSPDNDQAELIRHAVRFALTGYVSDVVLEKRLLQGFQVEDLSGPTWDEERQVWVAEMTLGGYFAEEIQS
ncbi:MAG: hypothetical protein K2X93_06705 [Candidatus Obscuribacterales bacterium]|nr:hypothetical protein [Candidatus Obscuribacterales bacterium]